MYYYTFVFDIITHLCYFNTIINFAKGIEMEQIHIRLPKETHKELKLFAVSSEKSINALVGDFIKRCLSEIKKEAA